MCACACVRVCVYVCVTDGGTERERETEVCVCASGYTCVANTAAVTPAHQTSQPASSNTEASRQAGLPDLTALLREGRRELTESLTGR